MDQAACPDQEAIIGVGEIPGDLFHPSTIRLVAYSHDIHSACLEINDEEDEVPDQAKMGEDLDAEEVGCC